MHLIGLCVLLLIGLAICLVATVWFSAHTLTHPPRRGYAYAVARSLPGDPSELEEPAPFDSWTLQSRGLALPVWDVAGSDSVGPTVIVTHGWGESRVVALSRLPALRRCSRRILLWDLPGHGDSPGICSLGTREVDDLRALIDRVALDNAPILLYGSSLGGGVSIVAAPGDSRIAGVIAEAPYRVPIVPARNVLRGAALPYRANLPIAMALLGTRFGYGPRWALDAAAGGFDRALHAARLAVPLLVLHGERDSICPVEDGRAIAAAAPQGRLVEIAGAEHTNLWTQQPFAETCADAVRRFVAALRPVTSDASTAGR